MTTTILLLLIVALATGLILLLRKRGSGRQQALKQVLDAADALEERLRVARIEIEAIAGDQENPVLEAQQEMLRQRLWLHQHGSDASLEQLAAVRDTISNGSQRLDQQLLKVELARATQH